MPPKKKSESPAPAPVTEPIPEPTPAPAPSQPDIRDEDGAIPTIQTIGLVKVKRGWIALRITSQGRNIINREIITDGVCDRWSCIDALNSAMEALADG